MGTIMALIAWEMTKGNVYGLASVLFLFSLLLWFIYLNSKVWTVGGIIMLVNFPLVLANAYQASYGVGTHDIHDDIYTIAAKVSFIKIKFLKISLYYIDIYLF